jgi:hypothetical protein
MLRFLQEVVPAIGMTTIAGPYVSEAHGQGIVIIAESHVWIGVEGSNAVAILFSCRSFSWAIVHVLLRDTFGGHWVTRYEVERSVPPTCGSRWRRALRHLASCLGFCSKRFLNLPPRNCPENRR